MGNARQKYTDKEWEDIVKKDYMSPWYSSFTENNSLSYSAPIMEKKQTGQKFSQDKAPMGKLLRQFPLAFEQVAFRSKYGHEKYKDTDQDWRNFSRVSDPNYDDACIRHFCGLGEENEIEHMAASIWNQLAELQIKLEQEND